VHGGIGLPGAAAAWSAILHFMQTFEHSKMEVSGSDHRFKAGAITKDQVELVMHRARHWKAAFLGQDAHTTRLHGFITKLRVAYACEDTTTLSL
jgi:hypothetical protein